MGTIADTVLEEGGEVIGVIPQLLVEKEVAHTGLTEIRIVDSIYERKLLMAELSDGFIALPGGLGTLNELFEVVTWAQLGLHSKPCGLLNCCGYFNSLIGMLDHAVSQRFILPAHRAMVMVGKNPEELLESFISYQPTTIRKWDERQCELVKSQSSDGFEKSPQARRANPEE
jgi:uncharacterized protein (TIGR00730 family)